MKVKFEGDLKRLFMDKLASFINDIKNVNEADIILLDQNGDKYIITVLSGTLKITLEASNADIEKQQNDEACGSCLFCNSTYYDTQCLYWNKHVTEHTTACQMWKHYHSLSCCADCICCTNLEYCMFKQTRIGSVCYTSCPAFKKKEKK